MHDRTHVADGSYCAFIVNVLRRSSSLNPLTIKFFWTISLVQQANMYEIRLNTMNISRNIFRVPKEGKLRSQWIESIAKYQQYDFYAIDFNVCELHFTETDFLNSESVKMLKLSAIPSVFPTVQMENHTENVGDFQTRYGENQLQVTRCCNIKQCVNQFDTDNQKLNFFKYEMSHAYDHVH